MRPYFDLENGKYHLSSVDEELDPWTAWAYKPRTVTLLLIGACFLMWVLCWNNYCQIGNWCIITCSRIFSLINFIFLVLHLVVIYYAYASWASGALDPERDASGDLVTSVKRFCLFYKNQCIYFFIMLNDFLFNTIAIVSCRGVWAMIAVFLAYCLLQAPSTYVLDGFSSVCLLLLQLSLYISNCVPFFYISIWVFPISW